MTRSSNRKTLACCGCSQPQSVADSATRVLCGTCIALGKTFPRDTQTTMPLEDLAPYHL